MAPENRCPVCRFEHIPDDHDRCPQCDADLTCFRVLETLREPAAEKAEPDAHDINPPPTQTGKKPAAFFWAVSGLLGAVVMVLLGLQTYWFTGLQGDMSQQRVGFNEALRRIEFKLGRISAHQEKVVSEITAQMEILRAGLERIHIPGAVTPAGSSPDGSASVHSTRQAPATDWHAGEPDLSTPDEAKAGSNAYQIYQVREDDTLWDIAARFYGSGFFYPVLLEQNPHLAIYKISPEDRITVLQDNDQVKRIYNQITEIRGDILYWYYTVRRGDTLASLRHRYCPWQDCFQMQSGLEQDFKLQPGDKIKIQLSGVSE
jgi:nucleoid-associated protein YgaU